MMKRILDLSIAEIVKRPWKKIYGVPYYKMNKVILPLLVMTCWFCLFACGKGPNGIKYGAHYETDTLSINADPNVRVRYVFSRNSVNIYRLLKNGEFGRSWIVNVNGRPRLLHAANRTVDGEQFVEPLSTDFVMGYFPDFRNNVPSEVEVATTQEYSGAKLYRPADIDAVAIARPGEWYLDLENAPVRHEATSVWIDWAGCTPESVCSDYGGNNESEVLNVESDGNVLSFSHDAAANKLRLVSSK